MTAKLSMAQLDYVTQIQHNMLSILNSSTQREITTDIKHHSFQHQMTKIHTYAKLASLSVMINFPIKNMCLVGKANQGIALKQVLSVSVEFN